MTLLDYTHIEIRENGEPLLDLSTFGFVLEPHYFQQGLSPEPRLFLREGTAQKLLNAERSLAPLRFKIWDAFRPRSVQNNLYQKLWKERHAAHPEWEESRLKIDVGTFISPPYDEGRIPPHSTGGTVDLTLIDKQGQELDMGTSFDFFGPEAAPDFYAKNSPHSAAARHREILLKALEAEGFTVDHEEWWHFDWGNQMWALKSKAPFAFYGETKKPLPD